MTAPSDPVVPQPAQPGERTVTLPLKLAEGLRVRLEDHRITLHHPPNGYDTPNLDRNLASFDELLEAARVTVIVHPPEPEPEVGWGRLTPDGPLYYSGWVHLHGTPCPAFLCDRPRSRNGTHWWCTEHQAHVHHPALEALAGGAVPVDPPTEGGNL